MNKLTRAELIIVVIFEIVFAALAAQAFLIADTSRLNFVLVAMFIAIIPLIVEKVMAISLPFGVKALISLALFLHLAGGIMRWYWKFQPFYDKFAHVIAALAIAMCIFSFFLAIDRYGVSVSPKKIYAGIIIITLLLGGVWEVGERSIDLMVKSSYNNGMVDTIGDTIGNLIGCIAGAVIARYYLRTVPPGKSISWLLRRDPATPETEIR